MTRSFDRIARPYRWLEYLTFGPALARCRNHFLPQLGGCRRALVLGDGDGRFLAQLLTANPELHADAVDLSAAMLGLLRHRACSAHPTASARLRTHLADARGYTPAGIYDLVVTHFFLDCFTQPELDRLARTIGRHLSPDALWVLSDFRIPAGQLRLPATALVRSLYIGFRLLTGLRTTQLPDHDAALRAEGLACIARHLSLHGLLTTELWTNAKPNSGGV